MNMWRLASHLYSQAANCKNLLYDTHFLDQHRLSIPVISVGNLTAGGSGKTPFVDWLLAECEKRNRPTGVVSRNYKAESHEICKVDSHRYRGAQVFGDEAFWLAQRHPTAPIFVGPTKWKTAQELNQSSSVQLAIVDDGFQHRTLHRDFDIVLLDSSVSINEYHLLPEGFMREPFSSLHRADCIIITKMNFSKESTLQLIQRMIPKEIPSYTFDYVPTAIAPGGLSRALAVSGIAKGGQFRNSVQTAIQIPVGEFVDFSDHYEYRQKDIDFIHTRAKIYNCDCIVTTAKDQVKLMNFHLDLPMIVVEQVLQPREEPKRIYEFLDQPSRK